MKNNFIVSLNGKSSEAVRDVIITVSQAYGGQEIITILANGTPLIGLRVMASGKLAACRWSGGGAEYIERDKENRILDMFGGNNG